MSETIDAQDFLSFLQTQGCSCFTGVPDSLLAPLITTLEESDYRHIVAANEGQAVGIACGWNIATNQIATVYMQNSGLGNATNPLLSLADPLVYSIPLFMIIGWRGQPNVPDEPQHLQQGRITCQLLETMEIPYEICDPSCWKDQIKSLFLLMKNQSRPVALLVKKGTFTKVQSQKLRYDLVITREEALDAFLSAVHPNDFIVATTGKTGRELFELRNSRGEDHSHDLLTVGSMGHASSIAFGIALGCKHDVWCIDGDGALLMHLGGLIVETQNAPSNFHYVVNVNGVHESTGSQRNAAAKADIAKILKACGFNEVCEAYDRNSIIDAVKAIYDKEYATDETPSKENQVRLTALVIHTKPGSRSDLGRPTISPQANLKNLRKTL